MTTGDPVIDGCDLSILREKTAYCIPYMCYSMVYSYSPTFRIPRREETCMGGRGTLLFDGRKI